MASTYSTELVEWQDRVTTIPEEVLNLARELDVISSLDESGTNSATLQIMAAIMRAESEEAVFAAANAGAVSSKEFVGIPFKLHSEDIQVKRSAAAFRENGGFPYYFLMKVTNLQDGTENMLTCGAPSVIAVLRALHKLDYLRTNDEKDGGSTFILDAKATASGFQVLLIRPFKLAPTNGKKA